MMNYKNEISYIYFYTKGKRGRNVGFLRFELKDDRLKIIINLKMPKELSAEKLKAYLYTRDNGDIFGMNIGTIIPTNSNYRFKKIIPLKDIDNSKISIEDIEGVYISGNRDYSFMAQLNDKREGFNRFYEYSAMETKVENGIKNARSSVIEIIREYIINEQKEQVINT